MNLKSIGLTCVILTAACGGTPSNPDVATGTDVPNAPRDVPNGTDVPNAPRDVPNGVDVPNPMIDVPNIPDVPNVIADTGVCQMGTMACGMAGCVDPLTDNMNCGACGTSCGMGRTCTAGVCACNAGTMMCGASCANLQTDSMNCGACGTACPMNQMCVAGACAIACPAPNRICVAGGMMSCLDLQTNVSNCGACGTACAAANGVANCAAGACGVASCNAGFANCDMMAANGCEVNTGANIANCGMCGNVCPVRANSAAAACAAGVCGVGACNAGFGNCNNMPADGCEVNLSNTIANCGACGTVCAAANGTPSCAMGACGVAACNAGFGNCDMNAANGCEANTNTDVNNCGGCGTRCVAGQMCVAGMCQGGMAGTGYSPVGPQNNVPVATVTGGGWTECYRDSYGSNVLTPLATIQAQCNGTDVMVACRATGSATLQVLAQAPRTDVFFDVGNGANAVRTANGSDWYYSTGASMGFALGGTGVSRNSCDTSNVSPAARVCYHTSGSNINPGWRCGGDLGVGNSHERVMYHRNRYRPVGPQTNVPVATVTSGGWTECYRDTYGSAVQTPLATIQARCSGPDIMLACRPTGAATLQLLAQAPRTDVFFDVGAGQMATRAANGANWYFNGMSSMGFAGAGAAVSRNSCDTNGGAETNRLCWHTGANNINPGWRCGANTGLNGDNGFERIIYQSAGAPSFRVTSANVVPAMCTNSAGTQNIVPFNDQRGVLAVTGSTVLYTGDGATVHLPIATINSVTPVAMNRVHDAMVSNLQTGTAYFFANAMGTEPASATAGNVTQLIQMTDQGVATATAIPLSIPIPLTGGGLGFYSGYGRVIVFTGAANGWYNIDLPSGTVTQLMGMNPVGPNGCESWAHSGIAEFFGGTHYVVFMAAGGVTRQNIGTGATTIVSMTGGGDVCSISISPTQNRWYSQYEAAPGYIAAGGDEHVVMCPATWDTP